MEKVIKWGGVFFLMNGLTFVAVGGGIYYYDRQFEARALHAEGVVTDLIRNRNLDNKHNSYTAIVRFTDANGEQQEMADRVWSNPPRFGKGDQVDVLYDPQSPRHAIINDAWGRYFIPAMFSGLGLLCAVLGGVFLIVLIAKSRKNAWLRRFGKPIEAEFLQVIQDQKLNVNGVFPFRVVAQGPDPKTGQLRRYRSGPIWVDPTEQLKGRKLRVLVDPAKPKRHLIDLSGILAEPA
ncbi:DUF3592 domain-containing protein [Agrobacterium vitis]|uniref:DUF3592 domain-containing protein n=1 Tax=Agrobacterium vitis TaxID=373 RepID=UPI0012E91A45|nr:DUF3592 domain-containing protein [Agrobacterium vitis]MVA24439.1 DUF3592 domain-containing protein [Agrobacterium vitis]